MRKILFRGKEILGGKWCEGHLVTCKNNGRAFITELIEVDEDSWLYWEVDPATVGQYTGLTDKNGNKIFEGDILKVFYYGKSKIFGVVKFGESRFFIDDNFMGSIKAKAPMSDMFSRYEFEVIGNIHDNPELAKI